MTAEGERFASPKSIADAIDGTRKQALEEAYKDAEKRSQEPPPPPPPPPPGGAPGAPPPPVVRTAADVLKLQAELEDGARAAMTKAGRPYTPLPVVCELAAPLTASCWNDLPETGELPGVVRWGIFSVLVVGVLGSWGVQFVPLFVVEKKKPTERDEDGNEIKEADVTSVR